MDKSHDKEYICILSKKHHVVPWSVPENEHKEYIYVCVVCN